MNKLIIILLLGVVVLLVLFLSGDKSIPGSQTEKEPPENLTEIQKEAEVESFKKTGVGPTM